MGSWPGPIGPSGVFAALRLSQLQETCPVGWCLVIGTSLKWVPNREATRSDWEDRQAVRHTPQENSLAERVNRTIMNTARATLLSSDLPITLWDYAAMAAADTYNHTPHSAHGQLPIALWNNCTPEVHTLLPFDTQGFVHDPAPHHKLHPRATLVHYIGRSNERRATLFHIQSCQQQS